MKINKNLPDISKQIYQNEVLNVIENNFKEIAYGWISHQERWLNLAYQAFNDHSKFLIVITMLKNTLDFYSRNFITLNYADFYSKINVPTEKLNILEISKNLSIPKESVRRKILELEKSGVIKKKSNKIILIDRSSYPIVKPSQAITNTSIFLSKLSITLNNKNILDKTFNTEIIQHHIKKKFSYCWQQFYEMQLPIISDWKKFFKDIETFQIYGICVMNRGLNISKYNDFLAYDRTNFVKNFLISNENFETKGINAMSISELSKIPRATVVRKLSQLVKMKILKIDKKKLYNVIDDSSPEIIRINKKAMSRLSVFATKVYNSIISSVD